MLCHSLFYKGLDMNIKEALQIYNRVARDPKINPSHGKTTLTLQDKLILNALPERFKGLSSFSLAIIPKGTSIASGGQPDGSGDDAQTIKEKYGEQEQIVDGAYVTIAWEEKPNTHYLYRISDIRYYTYVNTETRNRGKGYYPIQDAMREAGKQDFSQPLKVLGFSKAQVPTAKEVKKRFKRLAMQNHPDRGGKQENFVKITLAYKQLEGVYDADFKIDALSFNLSRAYQEIYKEKSEYNNPLKIRIGGERLDEKTLTTFFARILRKGFKAFKRNEMTRDLRKGIQLPSKTFTMRFLASQVGGNTKKFTKALERSKRRMEKLEADRLEEIRKEIEHQRYLNETFGYTLSELTYGIFSPNTSRYSIPWKRMATAAGKAFKKMFPFEVKNTSQSRSIVTEVYLVPLPLEENLFRGGLDWNFKLEKGMMALYKKMYKEPKDIRPKRKKETATHDVRVGDFIPLTMSISFSSNSEGTEFTYVSIYEYGKKDGDKKSTTLFELSYPKPEDRLSLPEIIGKFDSIIEKTKYAETPESKILVYFGSRYLCTYETLLKKVLPIFEVFPMGVKLNERHKTEAEFGLFDWNDRDYPSLIEATLDSRYTRISPLYQEQYLAAIYVAASPRGKEKVDNRLPPAEIFTDPKLLKKFTRKKAARFDPKKDEAKRISIVKKKYPTYPANVEWKSLEKGALFIYVSGTNIMIGQKSGWEAPLLETDSLEAKYFRGAFGGKKNQGIRYFYWNRYLRFATKGYAGDQSLSKYLKDIAIISSRTSTKAKDIVYPSMLWNHENRDTYGASLVLFILEKMGAKLERGLPIFEYSGYSFKPMPLGSFAGIEYIKPATQKTLERNIEKIKEYAATTQTDKVVL